jgi:hypothetical protein
VRTVGGVEYLRPEVAPLFKAAHDRPEDRPDKLADRLDLLGHDEWARLSRPGRPTGCTSATNFDAGATEAIDRD